MFQPNLGITSDKLFHIIPSFGLKRGVKQTKNPSLEDAPLRCRDVEDEAAAARGHPLLLHEEPGPTVVRGGDEAIGYEVDSLLTAFFVETDDKVRGRKFSGLPHCLCRSRSPPPAARHIDLKAPLTH